ncbi:transcriptional regulator, TetR family [Actinoalloteichus cyanogriseus DSM 43889]|uniref:Transcriptional regulator, TetR family n=2 Tax=Actinoalloteichus cyanogriseus TaxID=2893586 RepID=A0ABT1JQ99_ACTCY|nr:transcriptional regulator, TetR family [Actinoalloteichus caeruleus DSM 43889]
MFKLKYERVLISGWVRVPPPRLGPVPRGVAIPEIRQELFAAVERVIGRDGPGRLSGRAVTTEAGVASGLLYAHFADLDDFLAAYATDRAFLISAGTSALADRAGTGEVAGNLCDAVTATPLTSLRAALTLLVARPGLVERVHAVLGPGNSGLDALETATARYLTAEQRLGRIAPTADPAALALAVVGSFHHLALTANAEQDVPARLRRSVAGLLAPVTSPAPA